MIMAGGTEKAIKVVITLISCALFIYIVFKNYQLYRKGSTGFTVTHEEQCYTPPVIVCPQIPLSPLKLLDFNLDVRSSNTNFLLSYHGLKGVAENTSVVLLLNHTKLPLGTLIKEVSFGSVTETYDVTTDVSPLWKESKRNVLCHELQSLPVTDSANLVIRWRNKPMLDIFHDSIIIDEFSSDISLMSIYDMNMSQFLRVYVPSQKTYTLSNWASPLNRVSAIAQLHIQFYSVTLVKRHCSDKSEKCKFSCYEAYARKTNSCFPVHPEPNDKLRKPCFLMSYIDAEAPCFKKCGNQVSVNRWRVVESNSSSEADTLKITVKRGRKVIVEKTMYSSYQFYSDIGGCLGLFLGVSFLTVFKWLKITSIKLGLQTHVPSMTLVTLSVHLLLLLGTAIHISLSLAEVIRQPLQTFVTLVSQGRKEDSSSLDHLNQTNFYSGKTDKEYPEAQWLQNLLAERFAMRAFGCRTESKTDSIVHCILQNQTSAVVGVHSFLNLSDLPVCVEAIKRFPAVKYMTPTDMLLTISHEHEVIAKCMASTVNTDNNSKEIPSELKFLVNEDYYYNHFDVFVEIGGITGLYLGISILSLSRNALKKSFSGRNVASFVKYLQNIITVLLIVATLITGSWQLYTYLFSHPILTTTKLYPLNDDVPVSVTVCQWPPLNISRLLESILDTDSVIQVKMNRTLLDMALKEMASQFSQNATLFHSVWYDSFWNFSAMKDGVHRNTRWDDVYLSGHKCFTSELKGYFSISNLDYNHSRQYISLHARGDIPVLDVCHKARYSRWTLFKISSYIHSGEESKEKYGRCINSCFQKRLANTYKCHLPFPGNFHEGINCNASVILLLLRWSTQSKPNTNGPYPFMPNIKAFQEECKIQCHWTSKIFLEFFELYVKKTLVTVGFTVSSRKDATVVTSPSLTTKEVTEEVDGFTPFQLISKIGSATGVLLGESVGSLVEMVFRSIKLMM